MAVRRIERRFRATRQPPSAVVVNRSHPIGQTVVAAGVADRCADGAPNLTLLGSPPIELVTTPAGLAIGSASGTRHAEYYLSASPPTLNGWALVAFTTGSLSSSLGLLHTAGSSSQYRGFQISVSTTGEITFAIGNAGTNGTTNRRLWTTPTSTITTGSLFVAAFTVESLTGARAYVNGVSKSLTASGSASSYDPGTASRAFIGRRGVTTLYGNRNILAWATGEGVLTDTQLFEITINPWQLFRTPRRVIYSIPAGGASEYDIASSTVGEGTATTNLTVNTTYEIASVASGAGSATTNLDLIAAFNLASAAVAKGSATTNLTLAAIYDIASSAVGEGSATTNLTLTQAHNLASSAVGVGSVSSNLFLATRYDLSSAAAGIGQGVTNLTRAALYNLETEATGVGRGFTSIVGGDGIIWTIRPQGRFKRRRQGRLPGYR